MLGAPKCNFWGADLTFLTKCGLRGRGELNRRSERACWGPARRRGAGAGGLDRVLHTQ